ncbi:hypothetical protein YC2023_086128 [Brassica napus]
MKTWNLNKQQNHSRLKIAYSLRRFQLPNAIRFIIHYLFCCIFVSKYQTVDAYTQFHHIYGGNGASNDLNQHQTFVRENLMLLKEKCSFNK